MDNNCSGLNRDTTAMRKAQGTFLMSPDRRERVLEHIASMCLRECIRIEEEEGEEEEAAVKEGRK